MTCNRLIPGRNESLADHLVFFAILNAGCKNSNDSSANMLVGKTENREYDPSAYGIKICGVPSAYFFCFYQEYHNPIL